MVLDHVLVNWKKFRGAASRGDLPPGACFFRPIERLTLGTLPYLEVPYAVLTSGFLSTYSMRL